MLVTNEEYYESRERAIEVLSSIKERRKDIELIRFLIEKDTYLYIEKNKDSHDKCKRFIERLKQSRRSNIFIEEN